MKFPLIHWFAKRNMPLVALQWDHNFLDWIAVRPSGGQLGLLAAESIALSEANETPGQLLATRIRELGLQGARTIAALPRGSVEVSELTLPPASDMELPLLVHTEMLRRIPDADESAAVDFLVLARSGQKQVDVFAVLADTAILQKYLLQAEQAGLNLKHAVYRPLALVSLIPHLTHRVPQCAAHVAVRHDEVDVILTRSGQFSFARTFRLAGAIDSLEGAAHAAQEIGRTLAVADACEETTEVFVLGPEAAMAPLREAVSAELETTCVVLDPLAAFPESVSEAEGNSGSYAPLIGAILEHFGRGHPLDLLQTKQPPTPQHPLRRWAGAAVLAAATVLTMSLWAWTTSRQRAEELQSLANTVRKLEERLEKTQNKSLPVSYVQQWRSDDVTWIDELRDLSRRFPSGDQAMVKRITMGGSGENGGVVEMQLQVRDPDVITQLENALRDPQHRVRSKRIADLPSTSPYGWEFETQIVLTPRSPEDYANGATPLARSDSDPQRPEVGP